MNTGSKMAACLAATVLLGASSSAQEIIYDNSAGFVGVATDQGSREIGDMVQFAGTARTLTEFAFEYYVNPSGNETFQVFIRSNDGPSGSPGTVLYDSGMLSHEQVLGGIAGPDYRTFRAQGLSLDVPENVTWSVDFVGFEANEGGLLFYGNPEVGTSPRFDAGAGTFSESGQDFYYRKSLTEGWEVVTQGDLVENFGARFTAVPEPSTWALLVGGLAGFGFMARRRKS